MKAILLAAGLGTRLRPLTDTVPKCLVPIAGHPLMGYWLSLFSKGEIERVLVNTHYLPQQVRTYIEASPWGKDVELVHEDELCGTGGTILKNSHFIEGETFLVAHADNLTFFDLDDFQQHHKKQRERLGIAITMMTFQTDSPQTCGIVELDENGVVIGFHEKVENPPSDLANGAVYIFEPEVLSFIKSLNKSFVDISNDVLPEFMGKISTFHNNTYLRDIGNQESLKQAEHDIATLPTLIRARDDLWASL
ncbi:nucleotidyltransferase family protein [Terasakiella pusilla]|uniref:nucleotidyltransferase family protein n=1 Tax=Terasakiella pusilla TaxID=64973 RepID=UPI003AA85173